MKKIILTLLCGLLFATTNAQQTWQIGSPTASAVTATLHNDTLTISGTGNMMNWSYGSWNSVRPPWYSHSNSITTVIINHGVTSIGNIAFWSCSKLTSVELPNSLTLIGVEAFSNCYDLTSIVLPSIVTTIEIEAFIWCRTLTSINIPGSVTSIGIGAFAACNALTAINVEPSNVHYSSIDGVLFNKNQTLLKVYPNGKTDTSYTVPNSVTVIENVAFANNNTLTTVIIGDNVTTIDGGAFSRCLKLRSVTMGNSVTTIGVSAFDGCRLLSFVNIPNSVKSIGNSAFNECALTSVSIPSSVTFLHPRAFMANYYTLESIDVDSDNPNYSSIDGVLFNKNQTILLNYPSGKKDITYDIPNSVTKIEDPGFAYNYFISSITIPHSVTSIGDAAFAVCTSLKTLIIPNSVTSIGRGAFSESGLTSITLPNSLSSLGPYAFAYSAIDSIIIPNGITSIDIGTFTNCTALTFVVIPQSVKVIGGSAFAYCTKLNEIINYSTTPQTTSGYYHPFDEVPNKSTRTVYVLPSSVSAYKASHVWGDFNIQPMTDSMLAANMYPVENLRTEQLQIYPNPVDYELWIMNYEWRPGDVVELFDMNGKRVYYGNRIPVTGDRLPYIIDMSTFQTGTYILRIGNRVAKVVKQ